MSKKKSVRKQGDARRRKKAARIKKKRPVRVARRKEQEVLRAIRKAKTMQAASLMRDGEQVPDITDEEHVFWLCHGANYIASDEETGEWKPIFDGIYEGRLPAPEDVAQRVLVEYAEELEDDTTDILSPVPRSVLAWTLSEKSAIRIYKYECERRLLEKDPDCDAETLAREPHNPSVWSVLLKVKERTVAISGEMDEESAEA
jgi:hypothetical protein